MTASEYIGVSFALLIMVGSPSVSAAGELLKLESDTAVTDLSALDGYDGVEIGEGATLIFNLGVDATLSKPISGAGNVVKAGLGKLTITSDNTFDGTFAVSGGYVHAKSDGAFGSAVGGTSVAVGAGIVFYGIETSETFAFGAMLSYRNKELFVFAENSGTTVFNGDVTFAGTSSVDVYAGAKCVFNAKLGLVQMHCDMYGTDSEIVINGTMTGYFYNASTYRGKITVNTKVRDFGYSPNLIVCGADFVFDNLNLNLGMGFYANPNLDLNNHPQRTKSISKLDPTRNTYSYVTSADKTFLHVADDVENSLSRTQFKGNAGLWWEGPGSTTLTNVMTSTGDLKITAGEVRFCDPSVSSWLNVDVVTVSGTGKLALADEDQLGVPPCLVLEEEGTLVLPAGSTMAVYELTVGGESKPAGTYDAASLSGRLAGEGAKIRVVGDNLCHITENTVWDDAKLGSLGNYDGVKVAAGVTLSISNDVDFTLSIPIDGEGDLLKDGAGNLSLMTENYFAGDFTIVGTGTVFVFNDGALGSASGKTIVYLRRADRNGNDIREGENTLPGATLELCGVEIDETIELYGDGKNDLVAAPGTENVLNGKVFVYGGQVGFYAKAGGIFRFRGGVEGSGSIRPGTESVDSQIIIESKPMISAYLWNAKAVDKVNGILHFNVPAPEGQSLGYTFQPVRCGVEWALNKSQVHWDAGYYHAKVDLGGYNQRAKSIKSDTISGGTANGINGYVTSTGGPAMLFVSESTVQTNRVPFKSQAGFCLDVPADVVMNAVDCDTSGELKVLDGKVTIAAAGAWPNCPKVTVGGDGVFAVEAAGAVSRKARVYAGDDGVIDIPSGIELVVGALVVDGVELPSGRYSDVEGSAKRHFRAGGGTLVVRGESLKLFVR